MDHQAHELVAHRIRAAFDLYDFGVSMMRQNLRRRHPDADARQIGALLTQWLRDRPLLWEKNPKPPDPASERGKRLDPTRTCRQNERR